MINRLLEELNIYFLFFTFIFAFFRKPLRKNKKIQLLGISCVMCALILFSLFKIDLSRMNIFVTTLYMPFCLLLLYFTFEVKIYEVLVDFISIWLFESLFEIILLVNVVKEASVDRVKGNIITLAVSLCIWLWYLLLGRKIDSDFLRIPIRLWMMLDVILFILMLMMAFFTKQVLNELSDESKKMLGARLSSIGGLSIIILLFVVIYYYNKMSKIKMKEMVVEVRIEQQKNYFEQLLEKERETKIFRHEIINNFLEMRNLCHKEQYDQLLDYLNHEIGIVENIVDSIYDIGNETVNTVLNYYLAPIKNKYDIVVTGKMDDCSPIEDRDLCVLFANLVKNAVEAVNKTDKGYIKISINKGEKCIKGIVENTYSGIIKENKNGNPITTKEDFDNHGIGISSIKEIIKRYNGDYIVNTENGVFKTEVILSI